VGDLHEAFGVAVTCQEQVNVFKQRYDAFNREIRAGASEARITELQSNLEQTIRESASNIHWKSTPKYREFRERLWEINHPDEELPNDGNSDEEDLVVSSTKQSTKCPLTQTVFKRPVTNPDCGHSYSQDAIVSLARAAQSLRCPIHGCNHTVIMSRLFPNEALERRISRKDQPKIFE
jgi:SUMO ligase MMS21 Smc5/6 complex component